MDNFAGQLQQAVRVFHDCGLSTDINPAFFSFALHILHGNCEMNPLHVKAPTSAAFSACFCVRCRTGRRIHTPKLVINNARHHRSAAESSSRKKNTGPEGTSYGLRVFVCIGRRQTCSRIDGVFYLRFGLKGAKQWQANQFRTSRQKQGHHIVLTRTVNAAKNCVICTNKSRGAVQSTGRKPWSAGRQTGRSGEPLMSRQAALGNTSMGG